MGKVKIDFIVVNMEPSVLFLSDIHLIDSKDSKTRSFLSFLSRAKTRYSHIIILGDLFDSWPITNGFIWKRFESVIEALRDCTSHARVILLEGNHDFNFFSFFKDIGIETYEKELILQLGAEKFYLIHGDTLNYKEKGYHVFRRVVRSDFFRTLLRQIPGSIIYYGGRILSKSSRSLKVTALRLGLVAEGNTSFKEIYVNEAARILDAESCGTFVMGHIHIPEIRSLARGKVYANCGDWLTHFTYLTYTHGKLELHSLKRSFEAD